MDLQKIRALRALYATLPTIDCQGKCGHSCRTRIDMSRTERDRIEAFLGQPLPGWMSEVAGGRCPLLTDTGQCSVYRLRPLVCRLWGVVDNPSMTCDHGCTVHGDKLTVVDANMLILETLLIGGHDREDHFDYERMRAFLDVPELAPLVDRVVSGDHSVLGQMVDLIDEWQAKNRRG